MSTVSSTHFRLPPIFLPLPKAITEQAITEPRPRWVRLETLTCLQFEYRNLSPKMKGSVLCSHW